MIFGRTIMLTCLCLASVLGFHGGADAQTAAPSWADPVLLKEAQAEGALTVYSSMNEQEGLPLWKKFEEVSGIKVEYLRGSDTSLIGRIMVEAKARQKSWDIVVSTAVSRLPMQLFASIDPPQAQGLIPAAHGPDGKWLGVYANYNMPAYNTKYVSKESLPKTYEDFLKHKEWAGKIAIDGTDSQWLSAMYQYYGEAKAREIITAINTELKPVLVDGHLVIARAVAAGEYWLALNNYASLTLNMQLAGGDTDIVPMEPMALFFGQVGAAKDAPHPKAAVLAANYLLSREVQEAQTKAGRMPVRTDVMPNPPDTFKRLEGKKVIFIDYGGNEEKKWLDLFKTLFVH